MASVLIMPQPGPITAQASNQVVLVQSLTKNYAAVTSRTLGIVQIIGGIIAIICQAILTGLGSKTMYSAVGCWGGVFFIIAGTLGYKAGVRKRYSLIVAYMIMCIVGCIPIVVIVCMVPLVQTDDKRIMKYQHSDFPYLYDDVTMPNLDYTKFHSVFYASVAFNVILMLVAITELVTFIWGSALACKVLCCPTCCPTGEQTVIPLPVQYIDGQACVITSTQGQLKVSSNPVSSQAPCVEQKIPVADSPPAEGSLIP